MFVSDRLVFLQLQKTGCTHIAVLLSKLMGGQQIGKHNRAPIELIESQRAFVGSVRNPWDWYVSLWAYGCSGQGGLYTSLTNGVTEANSAWRKVYSDHNDPELFREWLHRILDPSYCVDFGERHRVPSISAFAGFFTYRYLHIFSNDCRGLYSGALTDLATLEEFDKKQNLINHFIQNERIKDDLIRTLESCGHTLTESQRCIINTTDRTNASIRDRNYSRYYDIGSIQLVFEKEQLIAKKHGYAPPSI